MRPYSFWDITLSIPPSALGVWCLYRLAMVLFVEP